LSRGYLYPIEDYTDDVVVKRRYDSAHRQSQALQTRQAILQAAGELFVEPGYAATPLTAVAAEAGVAIQTVYKAFGTKQGLLSALVDVTIAGDDEPAALQDRQFVEEIAGAADAGDKLAIYAAHLADTHERQAQMMLALAGAATADAGAAEVWQKNLDERRAGMAMFAADLLGTGQVRADHSADTVTDVLWLAMDVRNYDWLVRKRGWSHERFQRWYVDTVSAAILEA
jgi:TetR/AcrR family transcriptional regulator of autoinduction and epiphytic fitness